MRTPESPEQDAGGLAGWVPQSEVIRRLDVSRTTLYRWRTERGLPWARVGGRVFYPVAGIATLMREALDGRTS